MCQHTVLNDEIDDSQKGKSPGTRSVVCCLRPQEWSILCIFSDEYCWVHGYKDDTKNLDFLQALSPMIFAIYCVKKSVKRGILVTMQRISQSRAHVNLLL